MKITLLGAGAWGTALAIAFAGKHAVTLWSRETDVAEDLRLNRENHRFFPGYRLPDTVVVSTDFAAAVVDAELLVVATPIAGLRPTVEHLKALGCKTGLTIKPGTAPEALAPYLDQLDLVLVMSVEPGVGGQKFMPTALDKLRWLKAEREKRGLHYLLEVDGGVDDTTAPLCVKAGADVLVAGSAVFGKDDRTAAVRRLAAL